MFNQSKYTKLYFNLIEKYKTEKSKKTETHHVIPKSCNGSNTTDNLVHIPSRVHFILHKLLIRMIDDKTFRHKMVYALWRMMNPQYKNHNRQYIVTSFDYEHQRKVVRSLISGDNNPMKRPEIAAKFRHKRPEQSLVVTKRNKEYWATRKNPILQKHCLTCNVMFETNIAKRICCSKSCSGSYNNKMRLQKIKGAEAPLINLIG